MRNLLKALILWFLLLALPFQGFAAAGMLACEHDPVVAVQDCHDSGQQDQAETGCDACSLCGLGAAMAPPVFSAIDVIERHDTTLPDLLVRIPSGEPSTLDRPPRVLLA